MLKREKRRDITRRKGKSKSERRRKKRRKKREERGFGVYASRGEGKTRRVR